MNNTRKHALKAVAVAALSLSFLGACTPGYDVYEKCQVLPNEEIYEYFEEGSLDYRAHLWYYTNPATGREVLIGISPEEDEDIVTVNCEK
mgnify:FL=1